MSRLKPTPRTLLSIFGVCLSGTLLVHLLLADATENGGWGKADRLEKPSHIRDDTNRTVEVVDRLSIPQEEDKMDPADNGLSGVRTEKETEMRVRQETLQKRCPRVKLNGTWPLKLKGRTLYNHRYGFSLCFVPKAGCTFWKSVFHNLDKPGITPEEFTNSLLHQGKSFIHFIQIPHLPELAEQQLMLGQRSTKIVVFARDPYSRLFSAYVDKFMLHECWKRFGTVIVKRFRPRASEMSLNCGHDVTFEEFLRYVVEVGTTGNFTSLHWDDHWTPVSSICHLCEVPYDYVGKVESFSQDRDYIFEKLGLDKLLTARISHQIRSKDSINQTLWYEWKSLNQTKCVPFTDMFNRIWLALQLQGYFPLDIAPPFERGIRLGMTKSELVELVMNVFEEHGTSGKNMKVQRHNAIVNAYRNVSQEVKLGVQRIFKYDFELFDYDIEPAGLYNS